MDEQRDQFIQGLVKILESTPFTLQFKVKKKPAGVKIIYELTQEEMDAIVENQAKERRAKS